MRDPPRPLKRLLRQQAALAYEEELRRALLPLADDFDRWRKGKVESAELSHRIHEFHQGPAREIWKAYNLGPPEMAVAYAIRGGILDRAQVPPELLDVLRGLLEPREATDARAADEVAGEDGGEAGPPR